MPTSSRFGNRKSVRGDVGIAPYNINTEYQKRGIVRETSLATPAPLKHIHHVVDNIADCFEHLAFLSRHFRVLAVFYRVGKHTCRRAYQRTCNESARKTFHHQKSPFPFCLIVCRFYKKYT